MIAHLHGNAADQDGPGVGARPCKTAPRECVIRAEGGPGVRGRSSSVRSTVLPPGPGWRTGSAVPPAPRAASERLRADMNKPGGDTRQDESGSRLTASGGRQ